MKKILTTENLKQFKSWVSENFTSKTNGGGVLKRKILSDSDGKLTIENIDGYTFLNGVSFDNGYPLNVMRFGDYYYVGYYSGQYEPNATTAVSLMFVTKANQEVTIFYIKDDI